MESLVSTDFERWSELFADAGVVPLSNWIDVNAGQFVFRPFVQVALGSESIQISAASQDKAIGRQSHYVDAYNMTSFSPRGGFGFLRMDRTIKTLDAIVQFDLFSPFGLKAGPVTVGDFNKAFNVSNVSLKSFERETVEQMIAASNSHLPDTEFKNRRSYGYTVNTEMPARGKKLKILRMGSTTIDREQFGTGMTKALRDGSSHSTPSDVNRNSIAQALYQALAARDAGQRSV